MWNVFPTSNNFGGTDDAGNRSPFTEELWDAPLRRRRSVDLQLDFVGHLE
jgi:hypothetical protein